MSWLKEWWNKLTTSYSYKLYIHGRVIPEIYNGNYKLVLREEFIADLNQTIEIIVPQDKDRNFVISLLFDSKKSMDPKQILNNFEFNLGSFDKNLNENNCNKSLQRKFNIGDEQFDLYFFAKASSSTIAMVSVSIFSEQ